MSKKKKIVIIVAVALIVALLTTGLTVYFVVFDPKKNGDQQRAMVQTDRPQFESVLTKNQEEFASEKDYSTGSAGYASLILLISNRSRRSCRAASRPGWGGYVPCRAVR